MRFTPGYQDKDVPSNNAYQADWPKYETYDFYLTYQINPQLTFRASVENLTDRAYIVSYGESLAYTLSRRRTYQAGLEYRF